MKIKWDQGKWQEMIGTVAVIFCLICGCQDNQKSAPQPESSSISMKSEKVKTRGKPEV